MLASREKFGNHLLKNLPTCSYKYVYIIYCVVCIQSALTLRGINILFSTKVFFAGFYTVHWVKLQDAQLKMIIWHLVNYLWWGIFIGDLYRLPAFGNGKLVFSGSSHKDTPLAMRCWNGRKGETMKWRWDESCFQQLRVHQFAFLKGQCREMDILLEGLNLIQYFLCMCWWFSRSFTIPYPTINFLFASLKLLTNF